MNKQRAPRGDCLSDKSCFSGFFVFREPSSAARLAITKNKVNFRQQRACLRPPAQFIRPADPSIIVCPHGYRERNGALVHLLFQRLMSCAELRNYYLVYHHKSFIDRGNVSTSDGCATLEWLIISFSHYFLVPTLVLYTLAVGGGCHRKYLLRILLKNETRFPF